MRFKMKHLTFLLFFVSCLSWAQKQTPEAQALLESSKQANKHVYKANSLTDKEDFIAAEAEYRKALSEAPSNAAGAYNLANSYYKKGNYDEALFRQVQAAKHAISKEDKHKAFHNLGNTLMQSKKCKEAVEAFKDALRNDPTDDETRYNLALAKQCAEKQKDYSKDDQKEEEQSDKDKEQDKDGDQEDKKDPQDQQNQNDNQQPEDGDDEDKGQDKPQDEKPDQPDKNEGDQKDQQNEQPQPGKLSPQQVKNLLEAMNNHEQKVQEKMNADKQKGVKVPTDKDW